MMGRLSHDTGWHLTPQKGKAVEKHRGKKQKTKEYEQ
jgi:hypothetical protein